MTIRDTVYRQQEYRAAFRKLDNETAGLVGQFLNDHGADRWNGRPQDVPQVRNDMVARWADPNSDFWRQYAALNTANCYPECTPDVGLRNAELWWISADMCAVVEDVAPGVPLDTSLVPDLLPSESGLLIYEQPLVATECFGNQDGWLDAYLWRPTRGGVAIQSYKWCAPNPYLPRLSNVFIFIGGANWQFGQTVGDVLGNQDPHPLASERPDKVRQSVFEDIARVIATMAVAYSPGVTTRQTLAPDRPTKRRAMRTGISDDSTVRLVYMSHSSSGGHGDGTDSNYHHRWVVSGHWRSQPYGPGRTLRRPVWIAPHVKGPEGAPLLGGEKVRAVVR